MKKYTSNPSFELQVTQCLVGVILSSPPENLNLKYLFYLRVAIYQFSRALYKNLKEINQMDSVSMQCVILQLEITACKSSQSTSNSQFFFCAASYRLSHNSHLSELLCFILMHILFIIISVVLNKTLTSQGIQHLQ